MPNREEIAAKVADELEINHLCQPLTIPGSPYKRIWDALISAKVELAEREQKLERYKNALHGHLCANDAADWIACKYGSHFGESGEIYCDVCAGESPDPEHPHPMLRKVTEKLADSEQRVKELSEALQELDTLMDFSEPVITDDGAAVFEFKDASAIAKAFERARAVLPEG